MHTFYRTLETNIGDLLRFVHNFRGFNNIRMAMETVLAMAHAMGRTLVLVCNVYAIGNALIEVYNNTDTSSCYIASRTTNVFVDQRR